ncbi:MAG: hypothetical protein K6T17_04990 [Fimbriimonadales bacterium]|nr:hypothetical protein [Fimbriimonadales bacterium]
MFKPTGIAKLFLWGIASLSAQNGALGLTGEEILRMKPEEWVDFYMAKTSNDPVQSQQEAFRIYTRCLKEKNKATFSRLQSYDQERLNQYREILRTLQLRFLEIMRSRTGEKEDSSDEEIWFALKEELLFQKLIALNHKVIADPTQERYLKIVEMIGDIRKEIAKYAIVSVEDRNRFEQEHKDWRAMQGSAVKAMSAYDALLSLLPRERQEETLAVLSYCWEMLERIRSVGKGAPGFSPAR